MTQKMYEKAVEADPQYLRYVPDKFKTQEMCNRAVENNPYWCFEYVPDKFKTQEMCLKAVNEWSYYLIYVSDKFKTQEMCLKAVDQCPGCLGYVPDQFKTQEMCNRAVEADPRCLLKYVPDWFVTSGMMKYGDDDDDDPYVKAYKERKALKKQTWDELMPVAWHPSRAYEWCFDEDQKQDMS